MTTRTPPGIWTETLPSGRVRAGFRAAGSRRKTQRTFDTAPDAIAWAVRAKADAYAAAILTPREAARDLLGDRIYDALLDLIRAEIEEAVA